MPESAERSPLIRSDEIVRNGDEFQVVEWDALGSFWK